ncbi:hypothetical protein GCM10022408_38150 [Hymenobacter fastidiosus]|uniref:Transglutaminase-like domain-containing protein n=1 Tax=Hymenobacter fastidiosus TaxID=486264 RepID=A0ABP7T3T3_9BACT
MAGPGQAQPGKETQEGSAAARYRRLDLFARELPEQQATTMAQLARSLTAAAHSEDDKARLIFAWLAYHIAYDTDYLRGSRGQSYSPKEVLRTRRSICQGYADLFTTLARLMQVPAHTVSGYARTSAADALPSEPNHAWNVYLANGKWHLADPTWAAGAVGADFRFIPAFNPLWFDTTPAAFVFSHVPQDSTRQLLKPCVKAEQVYRWPFIEHELLSRGVSGAALLRALGRSRQADAGGLPACFPSPFEAQIEQVPLRAELEPRRAVVFRFSVPEDTEIAIENGGRTQVLQASGAFREGTLRPEPGPLKVLLWSRKDSYWRYSLLQYQVAPVLPLRELRRRFPDPDNVAYMVRQRAQWPSVAVTQVN